MSLRTADVLGLAADASSLRAAQVLAQRTRWSALGRESGAVWGLIAGSAKQPYRVCAELRGPRVECSCPSRKQPCKHGLSLLLLAARELESLPEEAPPEWVLAWLTSKRKKAELKAARAERGSKPVDREAQAERAAERDRRVLDGIAELELWLSDLLRAGLAEAERRPWEYWDSMAARLVDAQAPGLARRVRQLGYGVSAGPGWQEKAVRRIGRLYLALAGYRNSSTLPPETQADLRTVIGFNLPQHALLAEPALRDEWAVVGQRTDGDERLLVERSWLWGSEHRRWALVLTFAAAGRALDSGLRVGQVVDGELAYFPSAAPLRAAMLQYFDTRPRAVVPDGSSIVEALAEYAAAVSAQPWLEEYPLCLRAVHVARAGREGREGRAQWLVGDAGGTLELHAAAGEEATLLAVSGGEPCQIFGEYDGQSLRPLAVVAQGRVFARSPDPDAGVGPWLRLAAP